MQIRLRACEVEVTAASNAMQALWMAVNEAPDVIVTDYWMPAGSGEYLLSGACARAAPEANSGDPADRRHAIRDEPDFAMERRSGANIERVGACCTSR